MASMVAQQAMAVEKMLSQLAQMLPGFVPMASQIVSQLRQGIVGALQQSQSQGQGQGAPSPSPQAGLAGPQQGAAPQMG
jgi:hypothetical protein